jgi:hypothetical protein
MDLSWLLWRARKGHAAVQRGAFLECPQGCPERSFNSVPLLGAEVAGSVGVANAAAEAQQS